MQAVVVKPEWFGPGGITLVIDNPIKRFDRDTIRKVLSGVWDGNRSYGIIRTEVMDTVEGFK